MSKTKKPSPHVSNAVGNPLRSNVARGMILSGTGKKQIFRDRRNRRPKDAKHSWQREAQ